MSENYESLSSRISRGISFSENELASAVETFGKGCREKTKQRLESILKYGFSTLSNYGIFNRVHIENNQVSYCAGQSYPDEIRTVRELILKG